MGAHQVRPHAKERDRKGAAVSHCLCHSSRNVAILAFKAENAVEQPYGRRSGLLLPSNPFQKPVGSPPGALYRTRLMKGRPCTAPLTNKSCGPERVRYLDMP